MHTSWRSINYNDDRTERRRLEGPRRAFDNNYCEIRVRHGTLIYAVPDADKKFNGA